jgi:hypothetical protein
VKKNLLYVLTFAVALGISATLAMQQQRKPAEKKPRMDPAQMTEFKPGTEIKVIQIITERQDCEAALQELWDLAFTSMGMNTLPLPEVVKPSDT